MSDLVRAGEAPEAQVLARMDAARQQLAAARTVGDAKHVADAAIAVCAWLRRQKSVGLEIVNDARLLQMQAEQRIGEFLKQPGTVKSDGRPREKPSSEPTVSPPTHEELGIKRYQAQEFRAVADVPKERLQELADKATKAGREFTRKTVLRAARKAKPAPEAVIDMPPPIGFADLLNTVTTGDARTLAKLLPDESITLCLCDPVYENTEDYLWVARECERVLVPGGSLIVQCGNMRRFACEVEMRKSALGYVDLLAEVYPLAMCAIYPLRIQIGWKPYLWFSKGPRLKRDGDWIMNRVHAKGKTHAAAAKAVLEWGDAEDFSKGVVERLCKPGEVIWDPFTGSGTVPIVAKRLGLPYVAFEIDAARAEEARQRVNGTWRAPTDQPVLWEEEAVA